MRIMIPIPAPEGDDPPPPRGARPLEGGYSGEIFAVDAYGERAVLRIYGRDPDRAPVDAALLHLVRGLIPVPAVLDVRLAGDEPAHVLMSHVAGERLDLVLPHADDDLRARLAAAVTDVLATLSGMPFLRPGMFVDADLHLSSPAAPAADLVSWLDQHLTGTAMAAWDAGLGSDLRAVCLDADALLDTVDRSCLVHSDFNGKNLLVDPVSGAMTAVLDWEYAYAGSPYADLGNLLRFERGTAWEAQVLDCFASRAPAVAADPLPLAHASDLWALIDLAGRAERHAVVVAADELLRAIAESGDLSAPPPAASGRRGSAR
jgi:aminoglycoside phosphotransferase (APT) family kinase protein